MKAHQRSRQCATEACKQKFDKLAKLHVHCIKALGMHMISAMEAAENDQHRMQSGHRRSIKSGQRDVESKAYVM